MLASRQNNSIKASADMIITEPAQIWLIFIMIEIFVKNRSHLDNVHLRILEQLGEDRDSVVLEDSISLSVVASDDVAQGSETGSHHLELATVQESHEARNHVGIDHSLQHC